jgi:hypothetical protein
MADACSYGSTVVWIARFLCTIVLLLILAAVLAGRVGLLLQQCSCNHPCLVAGWVINLAQGQVCWV